MRSTSSLACHMGLPKLTGTVDAAASHLLVFYDRLGAVARPLPPSGAGAVVFTRRLDAPSGPVTAKDTPVPRPDLRWLCQVKGAAYKPHGMSMRLAGTTLVLGVTATLLYRLCRKSRVN